MLLEDRVVVLTEDGIFVCTIWTGLEHRDWASWVRFDPSKKRLVIGFHFTSGTISIDANNKISPGRRMACQSDSAIIDTATGDWILVDHHTVRCVAPAGAVRWTAPGSKAWVLRGSRGYLVLQAEYIIAHYTSTFSFLDCIVTRKGIIGFDDATDTIYTASIQGVETVDLAGNAIAQFAVEESIPIWGRFHFVRFSDQQLRVFEEVERRLYCLHLIPLAFPKSVCVNIVC